MLLHVSPPAKADPLASVSVRAICRRPQAERDAVAAEVYDTGRPLTDVSKPRLATLLGTTPSAIDRRRTHRNGARRKLRLADHLRQATAAERREAAREVGIDVMRDMMIDPLIGENMDLFAAE